MRELYIIFFSSFCAKPIDQYVVIISDIESSARSWMCLKLCFFFRSFVYYLNFKFINLKHLSFVCFFWFLIFFFLQWILKWWDQCVWFISGFWLILTVARSFFSVSGSGAKKKKHKTKFHFKMIVIDKTKVNTMRLAHCFCLFYSIFCSNNNNNLLSLKLCKKKIVTVSIFVFSKDERRRNN